MSDCPPSRLYVGDAITDVVPILIAELKRRGANVTGSADHGTFSISTPVGTIAGRFTVSGKSLTIEISSRPAGVSCGQLESKLQDSILDAKAILKNR